MAAVEERWAEGCLDTEEGECSGKGQEDWTLYFRRTESESSEITQFSTEASTPGRHHYQSLTLEEGVKTMDWLAALKKVEATLEEEIDAFSLKESRCRRRVCTLVMPNDSPLMRRRAICSLPLV
jgi:hypothetical protein